MEQIKQWVPPTDEGEEEKEQQLVYEIQQTPNIVIEGKNQQNYQLQNQKLRLYGTEIQIQNNGDDKILVVKLQNMLYFGKNQNSIILFLSDGANNEEEAQSEEEEDDGEEDEILQLIREQQTGQVIQISGNYEVKVNFEQDGQLKDFQEKLQTQMDQLEQEGEQNDQDMIQGGGVEFDFNSMITAKDIDENGNIIKKDSEQEDDDGEDDDDENDQDVSSSNSQQNDQQDENKIIHKAIQKKK